LNVIASIATFIVFMTVNNPHNYVTLRYPYDGNCVTNPFTGTLTSRYVNSVGEWIIVKQYNSNNGSQEDPAPIVYDSFAFTKSPYSPAAFVSLNAGQDIILSVSSVALTNLDLYVFRKRSIFHETAPVPCGGPGYESQVIFFPSSTPSNTDMLYEFQMTGACSTVFALATTGNVSQIQNGVSIGTWEMVDPYYSTYNKLVLVTLLDILISSSAYTQPDLNEVLTCNQQVDTGVGWLNVTLIALSSAGTCWWILGGVFNAWDIIRKKKSDKNNGSENIQIQATE